jgi:hypothetical protein
MRLPLAKTAECKLNRVKWVTPNRAKIAEGKTLESMTTSLSEEGAGTDEELPMDEEEDGGERTRTSKPNWV